MKIGVDLDGVIFDTEKLYRVLAELYDVLELKRNSIIDEKELRFQSRYSWSKQEQENFINKYHEYIVKNANFMPGADRVLRLLKKEGHELVIVTARGSTGKEYIEMTEKIFKDNKFEIFNKYYWGILDKGKVCKDENIDLMIDDYIENCIKVADVGIEVIYLKDTPSHEIKNNKYIKTLYNWGEVYRYIHDKSIKEQES